MSSPTPAWDNLQREPHRHRRKAVSASKRRFYALDLPQLLAECESIARNRKSGYCQIMQRWVSTEEVMK